MGDAVAEEYKSSLADLSCNSKPFINFMTILAEENLKFSQQIVSTIVDHIQTVPAETKLPVLYLIDSIIKNVGQQYLSLFSQSIVTIFASVFEKVDESTRVLMYKLRQTWNEIFPNKVLYNIDARVKQLDPAWPITAQPPAKSIHINPKFLEANATQDAPIDPAAAAVRKEEEAKLKAAQNEVLKQLFAKQKRLRLIDQKKREFATKQYLSTQPPETTTGTLASAAADPRVVAKLNPQLSRRDPRLQKVVVATVLNKTLTDANLQPRKDVKPLKSEKEEPIETVVSKIVLIPPSVPSATNFVVQAQENAPLQASETVIKNEHKKLTELIKDIQSKKDVPPDSNNESKVKNSKSSSPKKDLPITSSTKSRTSKRKRHLEELKTTDSEKSDEVSSPKKPHRDKGVKKESSPKEKSPAKTVLSQNESKKQSRKRSRSPIQKSDKRVTRSSDNHDPRSVKEKKQDIDVKHRTKTEPVEKKELGEDTDLRCQNVSSIDQTSLDGDESKENFNELDVKKIKAEKDEEQDNDGLFGREDQDYRQLSKIQKNAQQKGWASYKAAHPDKFKIPLRPSGDTVMNKRLAFDNSRKMGPRQLREFSDVRQMELDRLGRPRLHKMRHNQTGFGQNFCRESDFRCGPRSPFSDKRIHDIFSGDPKEVLRQAEEQLHLGRISEVDFLDIRHDLERMWASEEYRNFKDSQQHFRPPPFYDKYDNDGIYHAASEQGRFRNMTDSVFQEKIDAIHGLKDEREGPVMLPPRPAVRRFRLDNKWRVIHFIDDKAIVLLDNNEPRELMFRGEPTAVFIEGLKPITLRFDGKPVKFELDGNLYSMRFGAPSRELYINNQPYEMKFGGPSIDVMLNSRRVYRIALGGPPPQVQVSDRPVHDGYRNILQGRGAFNENTRNSCQLVDSGPRNELPFDIDMRSKISQGDRNGDMKDVDWRHGSSNLGDRLEAPDVSKNAYSEQNFSFLPHSSAPYSGDKAPMGVYMEEAREAKKWDHPDNTGFNPRMPDQLLHPDWRRLQSEQFQEGKKQYSPHHTPPRDPAANWDNHPPLKPPFDISDQPWMPGAFGQELSCPVQPPPSSVPSNVYTSQRNSPQPSEASPSNFSDSDYLVCPTSLPSSVRPGFNSLPIRPEFSEGPSVMPRLSHPPLPPWIRNPIPPKVEKKLHPLLPPPPRPPLLIGMPDSFIRQQLPPVPTANTGAPISVAALPPAAVVSTEPSTGGVTLPVPSDQGFATDVPSTIVPSEPSMNIDVGMLFNKLLAAGIISKPKPNPKEKEETPEKIETEKEKIEEPVEEKIPRIELKLDCLKVHHSGVIHALYRESQCASCGMRFKEVHGERYSRHLDWHFRMNRREKDGVKKALSRKWYYEVEDWIQFEEFEDFDDRARSFFDLQADEQFQMEAAVEVPSVPASGQETEACVVCGEPFQLFWVEEEEEWHLRNAVRHDKQAYHPSCYEDHKKASEAPQTPVEEVADKVEEVKLETKEEVSDPVEDASQEEAKMDVDLSQEDTDVVAEIVSMLADAAVQGNEETVVVKEEPLSPVAVKEEPKEEELQGKPGEEEIIGVISESDVENEAKPPEESEKVVFQSGGIVMKFRAESLKPASPATESSAEKDSSVKEPVGESEEEVFRPPTPDPRFQVLPPVQRGTELSGLCCIM